MKIYQPRWQLCDVAVSIPRAASECVLFANTGVPEVALPAVAQPFILRRALFQPGQHLRILARNRFHSLPRQASQISFQSVGPSRQLHGDHVRNVIKLRVVRLRFSGDENVEQRLQFLKFLLKEGKVRLELQTQGSHPGFGGQRGLVAEEDGFGQMHFLLHFRHLPSAQLSLCHDLGRSRWQCSLTSGRNDHPVKCGKRGHTGLRIQLGFDASADDIVFGLDVLAEQILLHAEGCQCWDVMVAGFERVDQRFQVSWV